MKIKKLVILLVCTISLNGISQNVDSTIYCSLQFDKGIAVKDIIVDYKCFGKDPIASTNTNDSLIAAINKSIMLNSNTAMEFYYNGKLYYISLHDRCLREAESLFEEMTKSAVESIRIIITIAIYENIYYRGKPYAVIFDIKRKF